MLSNLRALSVNLLKCPGWNTQPKRNTYIFKRRFPIRLNKLTDIFPKRLRRRAYYYDVIQDTDEMQPAPIDVVLTKDVAGVGMRGEKISMDMYRAYNDLLLPKLAVYTTSPEAQGIMKHVEEKSYSSKYSKIVENYLASCALKVIMSNETPWTLEPWHIKCALRQIGILANADCISIPRTISGPDLEIENKDFIVHITMNKLDKFSVRCRIFHWSTTEPSLNQKAFDMSSPSSALFPEEEEEVLLLQKIEKQIRQKEQLEENRLQQEEKQNRSNQKEKAKKKKKK